jgi:hypothetical protein
VFELLLLDCDCSLFDNDLPLFVGCKVGVCLSLVDGIMVENRNCVGLIVGIGLGNGNCVGLILGIGNGNCVGNSVGLVGLGLIELSIRAGIIVGLKNILNEDIVGTNEGKKEGVAGGLPQ